jgi:aminoglycoside phosphotransferase
MKRMKLLFFALALSNAHYLTAMDALKQQADSAEKITEQEKKYFAWFEQTQTLLPSVFQELSAEDKAVFSQRLKFGEHPEEVTRSRTNYVRIFYKALSSVQFPNETYQFELKEMYQPPCDEATLTAVVLKVTKQLHSPTAQKATDLLSARLYVYKDLLTEQERDTWLPFNYLANPQAAEQVATRFGTLLVEELAKLSLVENTDEAKREKAAELSASKIAELKKALGNAMPENKDQ